MAKINFGRLYLIISFVFLVAEAIEENISINLIEAQFGFVEEHIFSTAVTIGAMAGVMFILKWKRENILLVSLFFIGFQVMQEILHSVFVIDAIKPFSQGALNDLLQHALNTVIQAGVLLLLILLLRPKTLQEDVEL